MYFSLGLYPYLQMNLFQSMASALSCLLPLVAVAVASAITHDHISVGQLATQICARARVWEEKQRRGYDETRYGFVARWFGSL